MANWTAPLPKNGQPISAGDTGHPEMHNATVACIKEIRTVVDGVEAAAPAWADITGKPSTFPPTIGTTASTAAAGNHTHTTYVAKGSGNAQADSTAEDVSALVTDFNALLARLRTAGVLSS